MKSTLDLRKLDEWYARHFEELVEKYPQKAIAVVNERIVAVGDSEEAVDRKAREQYPGETPLVITVPSEEELVCLLLA